MRRRLATILGGVMMLVVVTMGVLTWWLAASNLLDATDDLLHEQSATVRQVLDRGRVLEFTMFASADDDGLGERAFRIQVIPEEGSVLGDADVPIDADVVDAVRASGDEVLTSVDIGDRRFRMLTFTEDTEVVQLATDITSVENGIESLRNGIRLAGIIGVAAAAVMGWLVARRFAQPIVDVTAAAAQLARDDGYPHPIESSRTDEIGQLAASFNGLLAALQMSREQQSRLVGDVSHELRTPLTSLRLKMDFLHAEPDLPPAQRDRIVEGATVELEALSALVSELIDLAAAGTTDEAAERIDLGELVEESARRARLTTGRTITTSTEGAVVTARPAAVRRALSNLIANAHKFSPQGAAIEIHEFGGGIEVRDHGPGVDPADRARAFDRFFRARDTQHVPGSGIGLAIVRQTAETHGGRVWIDEAPDGGAVVGFSVAHDVLPG